MMNSSQAQSPCALITGGGSGIGRATAEKFLREGWNVILTGRRLEPLERIARAHPIGRVLALSCDQTSAAQVEALAKGLHENEAFGHSLTALVNNAGIFERRSFAESDDRLWTQMYEANLLGPVRVTRALLPLLEKNRGVIVNVSSTVGLRPPPGMTAYAAVKAAMVNWTQALAREIGPSGVRVNCVCPGIVDTPIHGFHSAQGEEKEGILASMAGLQPLGRIGLPDDIAHGIWSLCGPGSEWITGAVLPVDGGINLA